MKILTLLAFVLSLPYACSTKKNMDQSPTLSSPVQEIQEVVKREVPAGYKAAYLASGCFWCVEAVYESVKGVKEVTSGYAEGKAKNAHYDLVSSGTTAHVEAVEVIYDPNVVSYETLINVFFGSGDPTTLNQQGPDRGYQYRSAIYFQNDFEEKIANQVKDQLTDAKVFDNPIVTDILAYTTFFDAEEYHQDFEKKNPNQGYVRAVSVPRLKRFQAAFPELLKENH